MSTPRNLLKLNVGFIINQPVGFIRDFPLEAPRIHLPPDLDVEDLYGMARITRTAQGLLVQVQAHARVLLECSRCLDDFSEEINTGFTDLYAFSPKTVSESGLLLPETGQLDLSPPLRDELLLAFPTSPICRPGCKGLCPVCGDNQNEKTCHHEDEDIDPRLSVLKSLL